MTNCSAFLSMEWATNTLEALELQIWRELAAAVPMAGRPFRTPALATFSGIECTVRIVVLRSVNQQDRNLSCYSDVRSPKVSHLRLYPKVEWLFYDPQRLIQIRLSGQTEIHHNNSIAKNEWSRVPREHRFNYLSENPPGADLDGGETPRLKKSETPRGFGDGYASFAVICTTVERIDWLRLSPEGHMRAQLIWKDRAWHGRWIVP